MRPFPLGVPLVNVPFISFEALLAPPRSGDATMLIVYDRLTSRWVCSRAMVDSSALKNVLTAVTRFDFARPIGSSVPALLTCFHRRSSKRFVCEGGW